MNSNDLTIGTDVSHEVLLFDSATLEQTLRCIVLLGYFVCRLGAVCIIGLITEKT
jgi:hypothetical protein